MKMSPVTQGPAAKKGKSRSEIGEERRARMRVRLIAAGARVIARQGSEKSTIDDFIREASVARGTFYNYFPTREDLLDALWSQLGHDPFQDIKVSCDKVADPAERLAAVTRWVLHRARLDPTWGWLILALSADRATLNDDLRAYPLPDLNAAAKVGRLRFDDVAAATDVVVSIVRGALRALLTETREHDYPEAVCKLVLLALGLPQPEAHRLSHQRLPLPRG